MQEIPEFIQGIATKKSEAEQRREIVKKEYAKLLDRLGKKNGTKQKFIHNDFLDVDVWFISREGGKEATKNSVHNWQSTYALLHLETIVKKQKKVCRSTVQQNKQAINPDFNMSIWLHYIMSLSMQKEST